MKKSRRIWFVWLSSYIIVVVALNGAFALGTMRILNAVEGFTTEVNHNNAMFVQNVLDDNWQQNFTYSMQIINNTTAKNLEKIPNADAFKTPQVYDLSLNLRNHVSSNAMIDDVCLYYPLSDYIIGSKGVYPSRTYWAALYGASGEYDYSKWSALLLGDRKPGYFCFENNGSIDLYYRIAISSPSGRILVAKINNKELEETLRWISIDQANDFIAMIDENNIVYAYSGNYDLFVDSETNKLLTLEPKDYLYEKLDSGITTLHYVTFKEKTAVYKLVSTISGFTIVNLLLSFFGGILLSVYLSKRSAKPLEKIASKLQRNDEYQGNEIQLISGQIDELMESHHMLNALVRSQNMMIGRSFMNECLKSDATDRRDVETIAAIYSLSFEKDHFVIIACESANNDFIDKTIEYLNKTEEDTLGVCWTELMGLDVFLVNYNNHDDLYAFREYLGQISGSEARIVISDTIDSLENIRIAYLDCLQGLQFPDSSTVLHNETTSKQYKAVKGRALIIRFLKHLSDRDFLSAKQLVPDLWEDYIQCESKLEQACRKHYIIQHMLPLGDGMLHEKLRALAGQQSPEKWQGMLRDVLSQCEKTKLLSEGPEYENTITNKARHMIDKNYANPMLDLRMIAEEIGMSQSYVSRIFKHEYGIGTSQYINQVRIAHSKELIRYGSQNIKSIALQVGFSSDVQFIRVFKKLEDVTPGVFRDSSEDGTTSH